MDVTWTGQLGTAVLLLAAIKAVKDGWSQRSAIQDEEAKAAVPRPRAPRKEASQPEAPPGQVWVRIGGREILVPTSQLAEKPKPKKPRRRRPS